MKHPPPTYGRPHPKARFVLDHHYPRFVWKERGQSKSMSVHRWVWEHFNGPVPEGHLVRFKDGDRWNWRIENLELVTPRERGAMQVACAARPGKKECTRCHAIKPLSAFRARRRRSSVPGYTAECKACLAAYSKRRRREPEVKAADTVRQRARRERDREMYNTYHREYKQRHQKGQ